MQTQFCRHGLKHNKQSFCGLGDLNVHTKSKFYFHSECAGIKVQVYLSLRAVQLFSDMCCFPNDSWSRRGRAPCMRHNAHKQIYICTYSGDVWLSSLLLILRYSACNAGIPSGQTLKSNMFVFQIGGWLTKESVWPELFLCCTELILDISIMDSSIL